VIYQYIWYQDEIHLYNLKKDIRKIELYNRKSIYEHLYEIKQTACSPNLCILHNFTYEKFCELGHLLNMQLNKNTRNIRNNMLSRMQQKYKTYRRPDFVNSDCRELTACLARNLQDNIAFSKHSWSMRWSALWTYVKYTTLARIWNTHSREHANVILRSSKLTLTPGLTRANQFPFFYTLIR